eukprot:PhF_6_TR31748/c0_g1_i3/m.46742
MGNHFSQSKTTSSASGSRNPSSSTPASSHHHISPISAVDAQSLPLVPHGVYALLSEHVYREPNRRPLPPGWSVFISADEVNLERDGYYATAYVNEHLQHIVISERGTADANGVRTGIWVYFDVPTVQFALAEEFSKVVRLKAQLELEGHHTSFVVSYAGHSLGAILATCRACAERTFAVTFESPGCRSFVEKTMHPFKVEDSDVVTYLRPPNPINSLKPHVGYVVQLPWSGPISVANLNLDNLGTSPKPNTSNDTLPTPDATKKRTGPFSGLPSLPSLPTLSVPSMLIPPSAQDIGKKIIEKSAPEFFQYFAKLEPYVRELFDHTQQVHSIAGIVSVFEDRATNQLRFEPESLETALLWPTNLLQYLELANANRNIDMCNSSEHHARSAYTAMRQSLHITSRRDQHSIPLQYLNPESRVLLQSWSKLSNKEKSQTIADMTLLDKRILQSVKIESQTVYTTGITAFQMKQYLAVKIMKYPNVVRNVCCLLGGKPGQSKL